RHAGGWPGAGLLRGAADLLGRRRRLRAALCLCRRRRSPARRRSRSGGAAPGRMAARAGADLSQRSRRQPVALASPPADGGVPSESVGRAAGRLALETALFFSLLFTGLAMFAAGAHLLELLTKLSLPRDDYIVVQQIYRGWALLGIVIVAALLATLATV